MKSEPARLGDISLDFAGIVFCLISFFRYWLNNIRTFVLHEWTEPLSYFASHYLLLKNGQIYWNHQHEFSLNIVGMYMLCFGIPSRFDFNMAKVNIPLTTV